jgi:hypothetical protein
MRDKPDPHGDQIRDAVKEVTAEHTKRPYRVPRLTVYGNLRQLALAKGGSSNDGKNVPASKL